jgi:histidine triad (HIT) family protein
VFCKISRGEAPVDMKLDAGSVMVFTPLNPVTEGHVLVVPRQHVRDFKESPWATTEAVWVAAQYADMVGLGDANLITSAGPSATQTVGHLHWHIVPRRDGDGLPLPWTPQQEGTRS